MTPELKAEVSRLVTEATSEDNTGNQLELLNRYLGKPYGDEVKGRSAFVDTSAQDAVEAILPEVMDVFTSAPDIVEFTPTGQEDEDGASQETDVVSHMFWQKNQGFLILYTWLKESMIQQNAYVWRGWVESKKTEVEEYENLTFDEYLAVLAEFEGKDYEIESQSGVEVVEDEITGEETTFPDPSEEGISLRIRCTDEVKEYVIEPFPREDFFITPRWNSLSLDGVPCCGRRHRDKTKAEWIAFGFSEESIEALSEPADEEEKAARHHTNDLDETEATKDQIDIFETYVRLENKETGSVDLMRVYCSQDGSKVLKWADGTDAMDNVSSVPISGLSPYIMPHRHYGQSVVEKVDGIGRVKTVLIRHVLDNIYNTNFPRPEFDPDIAGEDAFEDLMNPAPGHPIRTRAPITWNAPPFVAGGVMPLLEKFDNLQEVRTGATRYNQGLDADSLNKTMGGMAMILDASQKKAKLVARTFAETGLRDLFLGIHEDLRKGPMREIVMKLRNRWVPVNPRTWKHRTDMTVNVGMGNGDREERRVALAQVAQAQEKLMAGKSRLVDERHLYATFKDTLRTYGMETADRYMANPDMLPPPQPAPPQPDPMMMAAQAEMAKAQSKAQHDQAKFQADERERQRKHDIEMQRLRIEELKLTNQIENEQQQLELKRQEAVMKDDLERDKLANNGTPAVPYSEVTGDTQ